MALPSLVCEFLAIAMAVGINKSRPVAPAPPFIKSLRLISIICLLPYRFREIVDNNVLVGIFFLNPDVFFGQEQLGITMTGITALVLWSLQLDVVGGSVLPCRDIVEIRKETIAIIIAGSGTGRYVA